MILGGDLVDQTWTPAGSPYIVRGDVRVPSGAFLRMEAGTVVLFDLDSADTGGDSFRVELTVEGSLQVRGTVANPVKLEALDGTTAHWRGIRVTVGAQEATIEGAVVQHALRGLVTSAAGNAVVVRDSKFIRSGSENILILGGAPRLERVDASYSRDGFGIRAISTPGPMIWKDITVIESAVGIGLAGSDATITNLLVIGSRLEGVRAAPNHTITIDHATIHANVGGGVSAEVANGRSVHVTNSIISHNFRGVSSSSPFGGGVTTVTHSNVFGNTACSPNCLDFSGVTPGVGTISEDPRFVSGTDPVHAEGNLFIDLRLLPGSPSIDTGNPLDAPGLDLRGAPRPVGPAADMGAFEHVPPVCGDGSLEPGEACDDSNVADGDGCSAACVVEVLSPPDAGPTPAPDASPPVPDASTPDASVIPIDAAPDAPPLLPDAATTPPDAGLADAGTTPPDAAVPAPDADPMVPDAAPAPDADPMAPDASPAPDADPMAPDAGDPTPMEDGCSCRVGGHCPARGAAASGLLLLAAFGLVRRRRRP